MAKLVIIGPDGQQERDLLPVNTLGRHPNNSIQLLDRIVSKEHCVVELRGPRWILRDLGSLNGTYINDQRVAGEQALQHGDQIALGNTRAVFHDPAATGAMSYPGGMSQGATAPVPAYAQGPQVPNPVLRAQTGPNPLAQAPARPPAPPLPPMQQPAPLGQSSSGGQSSLPSAFGPRVQPGPRRARPRRCRRCAT
ncbi:MAG: FHA domain-containing protein [Polyangiales bacterium]